MNENEIDRVVEAVNLAGELEAMPERVMVFWKDGKPTKAVDLETQEEIGLEELRRRMRS